MPKAIKKPAPKKAVKKKALTKKEEEEIAFNLRKSKLSNGKKKKTKRS